MRGPPGLSNNQQPAAEGGSSLPSRHLAGRDEPAAHRPAAGSSHSNRATLCCHCNRPSGGSNIGQVTIDSRAWPIDARKANVTIGCCQPRELLLAQPSTSAQRVSHGGPSHLATLAWPCLPLAASPLAHALYISSQLMLDFWLVF